MPYKTLLQKSILIILLILFLLSTVSYTSLAASKGIILKDDIYISEENYNVSMNNIVLPYLDTIVSEGTLMGAANIQLYYRKYIVENSTANIIIVHDSIEYIDKYDELIYYFAKCGYNVFIMEHRGTGRSDSLGSADKTQVNVDNADCYVSDLKKFIHTVVINQDKDKKNFLFAHGIGAAVSTKFLIENDNVFDAAILSSPMMDIISTEIPKNFIKFIADSAVFLGYGSEYVPGQDPYDIMQTLDSSGTTSSARFYYFYDFELVNESVRRGGFSFRWLSEMLRTIKFITAKKNISKINTPVLIIDTEKQSLFCSRYQKRFLKYSKNCTLINSDSKRDIYREKDSIQRPVIESILHFYKEKLE